MTDASTIWQQALSVIKPEISEVSYNTWFSPIQAVSFDDNVLTIASDEFLISMIFPRYKQLLCNAVSQVMNKTCDVNIILKNQIEEFKNKTLSSSATDTSNFKKPVSSGGISINPRYTFDNFVVGGGNRFAHAASLAVAEAPSQSYNPLFLYGCSGLGKTHLMHAIGNFIAASNPSLKIMYVTSELFTNDLINSIKDNKNEQFRNKYRMIDVLLIDDIQFIGGKSTTEEEFFHTFNHLYQADKQIIISSDRHPNELTTLEDRLRSRFDWGLTCDIQPPDYETRLAILQKKLQQSGNDMPANVLEFIANKVVTNVRELEGILTRLSAYSQLNREPLTLALAENILKEYTDKKNRTYTFSQILNHVADYFEISPDALISKRRTKELVYARNLAMYISRNLLDYPFTLIGDKIKRDHSTVMYGVENIEKSLKTDTSVKNDYDNIIKSIQET